MAAGALQVLQVKAISGESSGLAIPEYLLRKSFQFSEITLIVLTLQDLEYHKQSSSVKMIAMEDTILAFLRITARFGSLRCSTLHHQVLWY